MNRKKARVTLFIFVFGAVLIAAEWAHLFYFLRDYKTGEIARCYEDNIAIAKISEEHVRRLIKNSDNVLSYLASQYNKNGAVTPGMREFAENVKDDKTSGHISFADKNGLLFSDSVTSPEPINIGKREHFRVHADNPDVGLFIGKPVQGYGTGEWSIYLSRRLSAPDGSFAGVVVFGINPEYFYDFYSLPELGADKVIMIVGTDRIVRARSYTPEDALGKDLGESPMFTDFGGKGPGNYETVTVLNKQERYASFLSMNDYPLLVVVSTLKSAALASFEQRRLFTLLDGTLITFLILGFCAFLAFQNERIFREFTVRSKAESDLRKSQELFGAFMDNMPAVVCLKSADGMVTYGNREFKRFFGKESVGKNVLDMPFRDRAQAEAIHKEDLRVFTEGPLLAEWELTDVLGREHLMEIRKFPVYQEGTASYVGSVGVDVTERRLAEAEKIALERRMQQSQKMESLGILAGGIAHDFNNLLMGIIGNVDLALMQVPEGSPLRSYLERADSAAHRASDLSNQMLAYSGKGRFIIEKVDLSALCRDMVPLLASIVSTDAVIEFNPKEELPIVEADVTQLRQVIMNLITNASDALYNGKGTIRIVTGVADVKGNRAADFALEGLTEGQYVYLEVSDDGCGMDEETVSRVFDPFFTTKDKGRGLGLASVTGIVRGHKGSINIRSEPGMGSVFQVFFPVAGEGGPAAGESAAEAPEADGTGNSEGVTVLLVDDEKTIREVAKEILEEFGYSVVTASDGLEGVTIFRAMKETISVVLLDMTMPRMDGKAALKIIKEISPSTPVILSSGFSNHELHGFTGSEKPSGFVQKPYRVKALIAEIQKALAESRIS
jgi:PAS domain S-box-containing protein